MKKNKDLKYKVSFEVEFKRNPYKGLYVVLEGIDGSGKTTQVDKLCEYLKKKGKKVTRTREPRKENSLIADLIQKILLGKTKVPSAALQYLFTADRIINQEEVVIPALKKGEIVISDRSFWSSIPYGIMDKKGDFDPKTGKFVLIAQSIISNYHQFLVPDYTFYLDLPLNESMRRIDSSREVKEIYESRARLKKTIEGYLWLLKKFEKEFIVIDGTKKVEEIESEIIEIVDGAFKFRKDPVFVGKGDGIVDIAEEKTIEL